MLVLQAFACGHGDTLLLQAAPGSWSLIDCHLRSAETKERVFDFFKQKQVEHLDLLCLTHYHADHYWGMADVLGYFTSQGRTVEHVCIPPVDLNSVAKMTRALLPEPEYREFHRFVRKLSECASAGLCDVITVTSDTRVIRLARDGIQAKFFPLAPHSITHFTGIAESIESLAGDARGAAVFEWRCQG